MAKKQKARAKKWKAEAKSLRERVAALVGGVSGTVSEAVGGAVSGAVSAATTGRGVSPLAPPDGFPDCRRSPGPTSPRSRPACATRGGST
jgi:hypothetical protein